MQDLRDQTVLNMINKTKKTRSQLTETKHSHPEPSIRQNFDRISHDRRHFNMPPTKQIHNKQPISSNNQIITSYNCTILQIQILITPERNQRPSKPNETRVCIRVPNEFPPNHDQYKPSHDTCRRHCSRFRFTLNGCFRSKLGG